MNKQAIDVDGSNLYTTLLQTIQCLVWDHQQALLSLASASFQGSCQCLYIADAKHFNAMASYSGAQACVSSQRNKAFLEF